MQHDVEFFPVLVTGYPTNEDHAPLLVDPAAARIARAGDIIKGDVILATIGYAEHTLAETDYFNDQYEAHPEAYDPTHRCGVCELLADQPGPVVVLSNGEPWNACDPWPADDLALIVPAHRLY